jgi:hypothetical protein
MKKKKDFKGKSKPRWQQKKEKQAQKDSQYDPEIHYMSKVGIGFGLRKDYKEKPGEASGANLKDLFDKWSWTPKKKNEDTGSSQN